MNKTEVGKGDFVFAVKIVLLALAMGFALRVGHKLADHVWPAVDLVIEHKNIIELTEE